MWVKIRGDGSTAANWSNSVSAKEKNREREQRSEKEREHRDAGMRSTIENQEG